MNRSPLHLATRTKVISFKSALASNVAPAVTASTNVRPLTVEQIRAAAAAYTPPVVVPARESVPSTVDVTDAPDVILARAPAVETTRTSVRPAAPNAPLPAMPLPATRGGFTLRSISKQVVLGLAAFGALVAFGSVGVAVRMHFGGVDRTASARPAELSQEQPVKFGAMTWAAPAGASAEQGSPRAPVAPPRAAQESAPAEAAVALVVPAPAGGAVAEAKAEAKPTGEANAAAATGAPAARGGEEKREAANARPAKKAVAAPVARVEAPAPPARRAPAPAAAAQPPAPAPATTPATTGNKDLDDALKASNAANRALGQSLQ